MKDFKNDSTAALSRFGRDKREQKGSAEQAERRPRLQRDAADSELNREARPRRASYNPHFTEDNRPVRESREGRSYPERNNRYDREERGGRGSYNRFDREERDSKPRRSFHSNEERPAGRNYGRSEESRSYGEQRRGYSEERGNRTDKRRPRREEGFEGREGRFERDNRFEGRSEERGRTPRRYDDRTKEGRYNSDRRTEGRYDDRRAGRGGRPGAPRREEKRSYPKYDPNKVTGEIRLNRFVAQSGICSRREADDFILAGLVTVNGQVVTELGTKVLPTDEVKFNDSRIEGEKKVYLVMNKPKGFVTSLDDPHADKTVMDLIKEACTERIYPVGRLDKNSVGLLLFTNDGDLTRQLTHPSFGKKKIYQVTLDKALTRADMDQIAEGITLEDGDIYADEIAYVKENKKEVGIEIHSGRNRIVRRIFEHLGYEVTKLDRVYYAGLSKKNLKRGQWRFLTDEEVRRLKSGQYE